MPLVLPVLPTPTPAERRLGRFLIACEIVAKWNADHIPALFANFVIVRADVRYEYDAIEYLAYSELFEPVPQAVVPPLYEIQVTRELVAGLSPIFSFTAVKSQIQN